MNRRPPADMQFHAAKKSMMIRKNAYRIDANLQM